MFTETCPLVVVVLTVAATATIPSGHTLGVAGVAVGVSLVGTDGVTLNVGCDVVVGVVGVGLIVGE
jgi:hypothetical protein